MKKMMLLLAFLISIGTSAFGQLVKEVTLSSETNLAAALGDEAAQVTTLKISGPLREADFTTMKDEMKMLQVLDMSGVTELPGKTFWENGNSGIYMQYIPEMAFNKKLTLQRVIFPACLERIDSWSFQGCKYLEEMSLDALLNLKEIGFYAFHNSSAAPTNLVLPNSIEYIEEGAFSKTNVTSVDFANTSLSSIGNKAFQGCSLTGNLVFPATLNDIGDGAFNAATVSSIKLKSTEMVRLGSDDVFESIDKSTCKVYVPKGLGATYKADNYWSVFGNNIIEYGNLNLVTATANNANYGTVSGSGAYEEGETVTLQANMKDAESFGFGGWYENNSRISTDLTYSFTMNNEDRSIEARFYDKYERWEEVDDSNKIDGISITTNSLTVNGSIPWRLNSFTYEWPFSSILYIDSPVSAEKVEVKAHPEGLCSGWNFISMPYDVRISDIEKPYTDSQFVIRQYDGATRAAKGMGSSWKQLKEEDVMKANQGYIMKINGGSPEYVWYAFNSSIDDMNKLFHREAVTTPLAAHASAVTADANWNLVGNPFPCYFSVKQLFDDGLDGTVTVWSDEIQNYEYYTKDDPNAYLSPLSAFFIQHDQATSVTFKPEGRLAERPSALRSAAQQEGGRTVINLLLSNGSLSDKTRIVFNEAASTAYELGKDAAKFSSMNPDAPMLYTLGEGNQQLAINERPMGEGILPLGCYFGQQGEYTLSAQTELTDDLYLYDQQTGACVNLKEEAYRFDAQAGNSADRFELRTALKGTGVEAIESLKWQVRNGQLQLTGLPAGATVTVADALGRICFAGDAATAEQGIALPESGIYYLTIRTAEGRTFSEAIKR